MKKTTGIAVGLICVSQVFAEVIDSGEGSVSTAAATAYRSAAAEGVQLTPAKSDKFVAGAQFSITGSLALVCGNPANAYEWNARVGLFIGNKPLSSKTAGPASQDFALFANTTVAYPGPMEAVTEAKSGQITVKGLQIPAAASKNSINYAINITLPSNFADGTDAAGHTCAYTFGFDYNKDGAYEYFEKGTLDVFENNCIRIGFAAQKGETASAVEFTTKYTYTVETGSVVISDKKGAKADNE